MNGLHIHTRLAVISTLALSFAACGESGRAGGGGGHPKDPKPGTDPDLATDDAVREAYEEATGKTLGEESPCIARARSLPVVLVGGFASDRGCVYFGGFVRGKWAEGAELRSGALKRMDWKPGDTELARKFVEEVLLAGEGRLVTAASPAFGLDDSPAFEPPAVRALTGGAVVFSGWVSRPSGMEDESAFDFVEYTISPEGALTERTAFAFGVPGGRTRVTPPAP